MSVKSVIAPWAPAEVEQLRDALAVGCMPADAVEIYLGRNVVTKLNRADRWLNIKAFRVPILVNRIAYTLFRKSKARRSYEYALRLRNLGFDTPEPLAWVERRSGILLGESYYVSQQLDGFVELRQFYDWDDIPRLADALAALMARLHDAGVWMKDFSRGNILRRRDARGNYQFFLVDINRMQFDVTDRKKLMTNFSNFTEDDRFLHMVARAYARHTHRDARKVIEEATAARAHYLSHRRLKKRLKL